MIGLRRILIGRANNPRAPEKTSPPRSRRPRQPDHRARRPRACVTHLGRTHRIPRHRVRFVPRSLPLHPPRALFGGGWIAMVVDVVNDRARQDGKEYGNRQVFHGTIIPCCPPRAGRGLRLSATSRFPAACSAPTAGGSSSLPAGPGRGPLAPSPGTAPPAPCPGDPPPRRRAGLDAP